jgi:hypothetical protein
MQGAYRQLRTRWILTDQRQFMATVAAPLGDLTGTVGEPEAGAAAS